MSPRTIPWKVEYYHENGLHVINIASPMERADIQCVMDLLIKKLDAQIEKTVIGPYFVMTDLLIHGSTVHFIADDAEFYPIAITTRDDDDLPVMRTIMNLLTAELCPSN